MGSWGIAPVTLGRSWATGVLRLARLVASLVALVACAAGCSDQATPTLPPGLPMRPVGQIPLPGDNSRFDYASLDVDRGLMFIAHPGENSVIEVDIKAQKVVRTIANIPAVHGVLAVGALGRVYAQATRADQLVAIDEMSGQEVGRATVGAYPDGLAYDSRRRTVWSSNQKARTATVLDATTLQLRGTVDLGGEPGNVGYDPDSDRMLVTLQGRNELAVVDPATMTVGSRVALPDCDYPHELAIDQQDRLVFVACGYNATVVAVDQNTWSVLGRYPVGQGADMLAYDNNAHRLYVAAESGIVAVLVLHGHDVPVIRSDFLADGAHVVVVDPGTHRTYYPVHGGPEGPVLLEREAT